MSSSIVIDQLAAVLFGKTRQAVLGLLYGHADEQFYLREIVCARAVEWGRSSGSCGS